MKNYQVYKIEAIGFADDKLQVFFTGFDDNFEKNKVQINFEPYEFLRWFDKDTMAHIKQTLIDSL
jgi:hypothetical protein